MLERIKKLNLFQKSFFIFAPITLIAGGLFFAGIIRLPAKDIDCSKVPKAENAVVIQMENNSFDPRELSVNVCDTLLFLNLDDEKKRPMSSIFDAGHEMPKFDFFQFQVTKPGAYPFYDQLHQEVTGKVKVVDIN